MASGEGKGLYVGKRKFRWGCCLASLVRLVVYGVVTLFLLWLAAFLILSESDPHDAQALYGVYRAKLEDGIRKELILSDDMTYTKTVWYGGVGTNRESGVWGFFPDERTIHLRMTNQHVTAGIGWEQGNAPREFELGEDSRAVYPVAALPFGLVFISYAFGEQEISYWKILHGNESVREFPVMHLEAETHRKSGGKMSQPNNVFIRGERQ